MLVFEHEFLLSFTIHIKDLIFWDLVYVFFVVLETTGQMEKNIKKSVIKTWVKTFLGLNISSSNMMYIFPQILNIKFLNLANWDLFNYIPYYQYFTCKEKLCGKIGYMINDLSIMIHHVGSEGKWSYKLGWCWTHRIFIAAIPKMFDGLHAKYV